MRGTVAELRLEYTRNDKDRHGNPRWYFVVRGHPKIRLNPKGVDVGSAAFFQLYDAALKSFQAGDKPPSKCKPGTFAHLVESYLASPTFQNLRPNSQAPRYRVLVSLQNAFRDEPAQMTAEAVRKGHKARSDTPAAANERVKIIRALYKWGIREGLVTFNPAIGIERYGNGEGHHTWTKAEMDQYKAAHPVGTIARLAFDLLYETAQRSGDVVRMGPQHLKNAALSVRQEKTGISLTLPVTRALAESLNACGPYEMKFLPYKSAASFGNAFRKWRAAAKLPSDCVAHGLRKARATDMANDGKTPHQIMAITGHKTLAEVERYTRKADQERLAREALSEQIGPLLHPTGG